MNYYFKVNTHIKHERTAEYAITGNYWPEWSATHCAQKTCIHNYFTYSNLYEAVFRLIIIIIDKRLCTACLLFLDSMATEKKKRGIKLYDKLALNYLRVIDCEHGAVKINKRYRKCHRNSKKRVRCHIYIPINWRKILINKPALMLPFRVSLTREG